MTETANDLSPAAPEDVVEALAFALRHSRRKRANNADAIVARIVAKRLVDCLARAGFVVMKRPPIAGSAPISGGQT